MMTSVGRLIAVIEMILHYHESGIRVLVGEVEPTTQDINDILCSLNQTNELPIRVATALPSSPQERSLIRIEHILDIVNQAGGWNGIAKMSREFRSVYTDTWEIFRAHVEWIQGAGTRAETDTALKRIAGINGVSTDTVLRKRIFVVQKIAEATLRTDRVLINDE